VTAAPPSMFVCTSFTFLGRNSHFLRCCSSWYPCVKFLVILYTVGYATTNDPTTKVCYNEQFLSMKSGCYNERGGILIIMSSSIIVFTRERLYMLFICVTLFMLFIRESLSKVFTKERLFMLFKFTCTVYKSEINFILFLHLYFWFLCYIFRL